MYSMVQCVEREVDIQFENVQTNHRWLPTTAVAAAAFTVLPRDPTCAAHATLCSQGAREDGQ